MFLLLSHFLPLVCLWNLSHIPIFILLSPSLPSLSLYLSLSFSRPPHPSSPSFYPFLLTLSHHLSLIPPFLSPIGGLRDCSLDLHQPLRESWEMDQDRSGGASPNMLTFYSPFLPFTPIPHFALRSFLLPSPPLRSRIKPEISAWLDTVSWRNSLLQRLNSKIHQSKCNLIIRFRFMGCRHFQAFSLFFAM
jgi:hypothetical protein